ncbi:phosphate ABC transporter permease subunit PstC [Sandaracinobacter sp. RS1-74]|uniref:phosphate ABC transporter permease subunit PstC n=1 Tax=Sandaracinobacteroides sayramensis TaxID=2913411 RepID=UPI001EDB6147|nr:phosphate ABC transporter permease subunit PstC [Sandaracinobacteroides sayramensis]MCG2841036.1 phosphate ABC transporter permease subunit PstC [Sandaracinobacteroides sayramensis]
MADAAASQQQALNPSRRAALPGGMLAADQLFTRSVQMTGLIVLLLLGAIIVMLAMGAWPALQAEGLPFFWLPQWDSVNERFGAGIMIYGTIVTSIIALVVAVPLSIGVAYFLTEIVPNAFRKPLGMTVQLLAAVPSIIYGMWGFFILAPWLAEHFILDVADLFVNVPLLNKVFDYGSGTSIFTAGLVLAVMILPLITAMFVEILNATPVVLKEAVYGLGATRYEVIRDVAVPYGRRAMIGAVMLGLGRALGETMAVTFVIGNATRLSPNIFSQGATIASTIANEFNEAGMGTLKLSALLGLGLTLFIISFIVLLLSRWFVKPRMGG